MDLDLRGVCLVMLRASACSAKLCAYRPMVELAKPVVDSRENGCGLMPIHVFPGRMDLSPASHVK